MNGQTLGKNDRQVDRQREGVDRGQDRISAKE